MNTNFDISALETAIKGIVKTAAVSANVYTNRPKAAVPHDDFVVVSVSDNLEDKEAYAQTFVSVDLFSRDVKNEKNGAKLQVMFNKLVAAMPAESGNYLIDLNPTILPDVPDDFGFHARIIQYQITIKS